MITCKLMKTCYVNIFYAYVNNAYFIYNAYVYNDYVIFFWNYTPYC